MLEEVLRLNDRIADFSKIFTYAHNFIYLGRGYNYPTALEGALKLKEISYIHAEGYPAAEMKHGPIALIDAEMPTIAIATPDHTYEKTASNIEEIKAPGRQGYHRDRQGRRAGTQELRLLYRSARRGGVPDARSWYRCRCSCWRIISLSIKGATWTQPRNLAKSVTVE